MRNTVREIQATREALPQDARGNQGQGVVVGIVDFGCDFAHENFLNEKKKTRLLALWDQTGPGRLIQPDEIDRALATASPYETLAYRPREQAHGTHVMDIAAGNGAGTGAPGVAPNADLIFVHLANDVPLQGEGVVGSTIGDSVRLLEALRFVFDQAGARPCVVNVSLGTNGGPHDGSTLVEQAMDELLREKPNRAIVIAAGNAYEDANHAAGTVAAGEHTDLVWRVREGDRTDNEVEIWYDGDDELTVEILDPAHESRARVALDRSACVEDGQGNALLCIAHRRHDPNNGDNVCGVFLEHGAPGGDWTIRLHGTTIRNGSFHAWIEGDPVDRSRFAPPNDSSHTLGSISCGTHTIVVGAYDARRPDVPLSSISSAGPTRDGRYKPDLSAPGDRVWAASATTRDDSYMRSGTSQAAPAVAGVIALAFAEAVATNIELPIETLREILIQTARRAPGAAWDPRYGYGRIDARAVVEEVRKLSQAPARARRRAERRPPISPAP